MRKALLRIRIQDRCYFDPCIRIWDLRMFIQRACRKLLVKKYLNLVNFSKNFLYFFKNKIIFNFVKLMPTKVP